MITEAKADLNVYREAGDAQCCGTDAKPSEKEESCCTAVPELPQDMHSEDLNQWAGMIVRKYHDARNLMFVIIGSFKIYAVKR